MSKKMTPCDKLGYEVGDKFTVIEKSYMFNVGDVAILQSDDGSSYPFFTNDKVKEVYPGGVACFLSDIKPIAKLKPAKQALADAIHQNGGWREQANYAVQSGGNLRIHFTDDDNKPVRCEDGGWRCQYGFMFFGSTSPLKSKLPNWHQTILSRDEYLTAYPEHKVEVEMKSESEMTIKVGDWHKNGELPPVGEVVMLNSTNPNDYWAHHVGHELTVVAHDKDSRGVDIAVYRFIDADGYNEYRGLVANAFMPLRTDRDKAIDEIISTAKKIGWNSEMASQIIGEVAVELYEAGYRKEVK